MSAVAEPRQPLRWRGGLRGPSLLLLAVLVVLTVVKQVRGGSDGCGWMQGRAGAVGEPPPLPPTTLSTLPAASRLTFCPM